MSSSSEPVPPILAATALPSKRSLLSRYLARKDTAGIAEHEEETPKGSLGLKTRFEPNGEAVADLIFVHGLNGGSRSTWSKTSNGNNTFWPKDWLPCDNAFGDVRIHTFGYSSGLNHRSILDIADFAGNLLACIRHCPAMASNDTTGPIIFVGHSMGGLVIKKAYILARQISEYGGLADRIRAMFFLATPHQGAGIAQLLGRFLAIVPGARPFVNDLVPQSHMLQAINDEFPRYCQKLQLFSFFETKPMFYGVGKGLIVERHCAVMNYPNERRTYLDANHRDAARFSTKTEPSYVLVRNALATFIDSQKQSLKIEKKKFGDMELDALSLFLGVPSAPEDDLMANELRKLPGTCQWLVQKDTFQQWRDALTSEVFWLQGRPGAGKSVLASHVINHLRALDLDCCYFFCINRDNSKATISALLRSIAWQMAVLHPEIFTMISIVANSWKERPIDKVDHIMVWRRIFTTAISKIRFKNPQYWIIDALDECNNGLELMALLKKIQEMWPVCILVTSRTSADAYLKTSNPPMDVIAETILEDNKTDIAAFLNANLHHLPGTTTSAQQDVSDRILQNASGCFLWVSVIVRELREVHTTAEINQVLDSNPSDMDAFYARILDEMSRAKFGKDLAKAILTWVTCASRPLSVEEIHFAIENDIGDSINSIEKSIGTCGNLVFIDEAKKIQLIHLTAREFLMRKDVRSEFIIDRPVAHKRLALICIRSLCGVQGNTKKTSGNRRFANDRTNNSEQALYDYAAAYLFEHLLQADSTDTETFIELAKFFSSHKALAWIERLAGQSDLQRLYQAGKDCTSLATRRAQAPPIGVQGQMSLIERWGIDLVRLVNKFGKRLNQFPSSIHYLIPPFCPSESVFRKQFANPHLGLHVQGCISKNWDDCLGTISYPRPSKPTDVISSGNRIAVVLSNSTVIIYDNTTLVETNILLHREPIWSVAFSEDGNLFASGGAKTVRVWNLCSSEEVISFRVPAVCMSLGFIDDDNMLLVAVKNNSILYWDIANNVSRGEPIDWTRDLLNDDPQVQARRPTIAAFSPEQNLLAIVYRGEDILVWTPDGEQVHDMYEKESGSYRYASTKVADGSTTVWTVIFGSTEENHLLIAAYSDGDLVVYDTDSGERRSTLENVNAQTLACSPDGRTLATADSQGNIDLFDLRTLKFISRLRHDTDPIRTKKLAFTSNNLRLLDIQGRLLSVWDSTILLRQGSKDENYNTASFSTIPQSTDCDSGRSIAITAIACMRNSPRVICGNDEGAVHIYNIASEPHGQELFIHTPNCTVTLLHFDDRSNTLTCADTAGRVTCRILIQKAAKTWVTSKILFDYTHTSPIVQVIASLERTRLLISTFTKDVLWNLDMTDSNRIQDIESNAKPSWLTSPREDFLLRFNKTTAKVYSWELLAPVRSVALGLHDDIPLTVESVTPLLHPQYFITVQSSGTDERSPTRMYHLWDFRDFTSESDKATPVLDFAKLDVKVETFIGIANERAVFLDPDNWVCSADIITPGSVSSMAAAGSIPITANVTRHFFIPDDWVSLVNKPLVDVQQSGEIIFAKRANLAVIRRGLEITDKGVFSSRRVSTSRSIPRRPADRRHITT
ncbi:hypothetical protein F4777DRAFT_19089 [Nemania sp. FL0916]|nr:hypothetical protein F4777DRAFT_19089 [Nemania sp. FL0916]